MLRTVPGSVPAIMFLSRGQSEKEAVLNLNAMNKPKRKKRGRSPNTLSKLIGKKPWSLSFSLGQAPQQSILKAWAGTEENFDEAQTTLRKICEANSEAALGAYKGDAQVDKEAALRSFKGKAKLVESAYGSHRVWNCKY